MAHGVPEELAARYQKWQTEELVHAVTLDAEDYTPEALDLMNQELERRGSPVAQRSELVEAVAQESERQLRQYAGVRGLLVWMVLVIAINSVMALLGALRFLETPLVIYQVFAIAEGSLGVLGVVACVYLMQRKSNAPSYARTWFLLAMTIGLAEALYSFSEAGMSVSVPIGNMAVCALWLSYLSASKRVKATYGSQEAPSR